VAEFLAVPVATLYAWRRRGIGPPAIPIGKYLRFDPAELRAWVDEKRRAS
jgi:predicted DNA-binding transcriptional regulator AlpA